MTEKSLSIVLAPNLIGDDVSPLEQMKMITDLSERYEAHCVEKKSKDNPIIDWMDRMYNEDEEASE